MQSAASEPTHIDLARLVSSSWSLFVARPGTHVLAFLVVVCGGALTLGFAAAPLLVGYLRVIDRLRRDEDAELGDVLEGLSSFAPAFLCGLITAAAIAIGAALIVLPGVVVAVVWAYGLWFVALRDKSATDALAASWGIARANTSSLVLVLLTAVALNFVGGLLVVGLLVTGPLALIFMTSGFAELDRA